MTPFGISQEEEAAENERRRLPEEDEERIYQVLLSSHRTITTTTTTTTPKFHRSMVQEGEEGSQSGEEDLPPQVGEQHLEPSYYVPNGICLH